MKIFVGRIIMLAVILFAIVGCSSTSAIDTGSEAKDFALTDINGKSVTLSEYKGKVIIVDFFASWCPPCRKGVPEFVELQKEYQDKGLAIIGVALVSQKEAKDFADSMKINYPVLIDDGKASDIYGPVRSIPTTIIIGKDFKVAQVFIGYRPKEIFKKEIDALLK